MPILKASIIGRLVGEMALLLPDLRIIRISVLDFWGNREVCSSCSNFDAHLVLLLVFEDLNSGQAHMALGSEGESKKESFFAKEVVLEASHARVCSQWALMDRI